MNQPSRKLRVGVIFGGRSGEHEVSIRSARSILAALDREKYEVVPIGITKAGRWLVGDVVELLGAGEAIQTPATKAVTLAPEPGRSGLMPLDNNAEMASAPLDVLIPVLHGTFGEDGTVQGLLELAGLPYVGAGVVGSAVGMDKAIFKLLMTAAGLPILPWLLVQSTDLERDSAEVIARIEAALAYPVFTKPANLGSSVGITKCLSAEDLVSGLRKAAEYDRRLVVEQGIEARELEVAVLGNDEPVASIVGEIRPRREFYDYVAKYMSDDSELLIPAPISAEQAEEVRRLAVEAFRLIDGAGLGRVDFLLEKETGVLYINEINTIPGFTSISMYPKLWEATGLPYAALLDRLIELALERHGRNARLKREFTGENG